MDTFPPNQPKTYIDKFSLIPHIHKTKYPPQDIFQQIGLITVYGTSLYSKEARKKDFFNTVNYIKGETQDNMRIRVIHHFTHWQLYIKKSKHFKVTDEEFVLVLELINNQTNKKIPLVYKAGAETQLDKELYILGNDLNNEKNVPGSGLTDLDFEVMVLNDIVEKQFEL